MNKYVLLYRNIIIQAVLDVLSGTNRRKQEVYDWLDTQDFLDICEMANADPSVIRHHIKNNPQVLKKHLRVLGANPSYYD